MRLQKYMADAGVASRRKCEEYIRDGRVTINGAVAVIGSAVEEGDEVLLDGRPLGTCSERIVLALNKPRGVVSASSDPQGRKTVQDLIRDVPGRLYNVGRLDINTEGLLLMTNDGELDYRLTHPSFRVEKTYFAVADGKVTASEFALLTNGVRLEDGMTAPARIGHVRFNKEGNTSFLITIHEGRNRQIRRMIEAVGHKTIRLRRERFGIVSIGDIPAGKYRVLSPEEVSALRCSVGLPEMTGK